VSRYWKLRRLSENAATRCGPYFLARIADLPSCLLIRDSPKGRLRGCWLPPKESQPRWRRENASQSSRADRIARTTSRTCVEDPSQHTAKNANERIGNLVLNQRNTPGSSCCGRRPSRIMRRSPSRWLRLTSSEQPAPGGAVACESGRAPPRHERRTPGAQPEPRTPDPLVATATAS